jgi:hypothetical protein
MTRGAPAGIFSRGFSLVWVASYTGFLSFSLIRQPTLPLYVHRLGGSAAVIGWLGGALLARDDRCRPAAGAAT